MKTKEDIQDRIADCFAELQQLNEWHVKAYKKYEEDRKLWGEEADRGEMDHVSDLQTELHKEIAVLNWVLNSK